MYQGLPSAVYSSFHLIFTVTKGRSFNSRFTNEAMRLREVNYYPLMAKWELEVRSVAFSGARVLYHCSWIASE